MAKFEELSKLRLEEARKAKEMFENQTVRKPPIPKLEDGEESVKYCRKEGIDFLKKNAIAVIKSVPGGQAVDRSIDSQQDRQVIVDFVKFL